MVQTKSRLPRIPCAAWRRECIAKW